MRPGLAKRETAPGLPWLCSRIDGRRKAFPQAYLSASSKEYLTGNKQTPRLPIAMQLYYGNGQAGCFSIA